MKPYKCLRTYAKLRLILVIKLTIFPFRHYRLCPDGLSHLLVFYIDAEVAALLVMKFVNDTNIHL